MLNISGFLDKFKKFDADKSLQRENIAKTLEKTLGVAIPIKNFTIKDGVLFVQGSPALKQEIFFKKTQIISALTDLGQKISDVR
jgi:hypothetical protein